MAAFWFFVTIMVAISTPIPCQARGRRGVVRIALRSSGNSDLCVRVRNSALQLAPCGDGGQVFDQITVGSNGVQLRLSKVDNRVSTCVISSVTTKNTDNDDIVTVNDDDDTIEETSGSEATVITETCNKKRKSQMWSFRTTSGGIQVINNRSKKCITADPTSGSLLITSKCNTSNSRQIWNAIRL